MYNRCWPAGGMTSLGQQKEALETVRRTVERSAHLICRDPSIVFPHLYNYLQWPAAQNEFLQARIEAVRRRYRRPWLRFMVRPPLSGAYLRSFRPGAGLPRAAQFLPDGERLVCLAGGCLSIWDLASGAEQTSFPCPEIGVRRLIPSPDRRRLALLGEGKNWSGRVALYDLEARRQIAELMGHSKGIADCQFSPDGRLFLTGGAEGTTRLWDCETGREIGRCGRHNSVNRCRFSPDGSRFLSVGRDGKINLWETKCRKLLASWVWQPDALGRPHAVAVVADCAFSADGKRIVAGIESTLVIWDIEASEGAQIRIPHAHTGNSGVTRCVFTPDQGRVLTAGWSDSLIKCWDAETGAELLSFVAGSRVVAFSPDGTRAASVQYGREVVYLWDTGTGERLAVLRGHTGDIDSLVFSPDSRYLLSGSDDDDTFRLWDARAEKEADSWTGHDWGTHQCAFTPDGTTLVTGGWDDYLRVWSVPALAPRATAHTEDGELKQLALAPDGATGLTRGYRSRQKGGHAGVSLWRVGDASLLGELREAGESIDCCVWSPDGQQIATGAGTQVSVWDAASRQKLRELAGHSERIALLRFSPDGKRLASASSKEILVWDTLRWEPLFSRPAARVSACAWQAEGDWLYVVDGRTLRVLNGASGLLMRTSELGERFDPAGQLAVSPDGARVLIGSGTGFETQFHQGPFPLLLDGAGRRVAELRGHDQGSHTALFSPDSTLVFTTEDEGRIFVWDAGDGTRLCRQPSAMGAIIAGAFSPDGQYVALGDNLGYLQLVRLENFATRPGRMSRPAAGGA